VSIKQQWMRICEVLCFILFAFNTPGKVMIQERNPPMFVPLANASFGANVSHKALPKFPSNPITHS
jgi:hypothetical protein